MFNWLLVNVVLSVLALLYVTLNASAPHRLRFFACFTALLAWLVPWQFVPDFLPHLASVDLAQMQHELAANTSDYSVLPIVIISTAAQIGGNFVALTFLQLGFIVFCAAGLVWFTWHLCRHQLRLTRLAQGGEDGSALLMLRGLTSPVPVMIQREISGAFSSGLLKPRLWIHQELTTSAQLPTLLRHELTHIRQHDNWYLLFITLVEKLFWWNPLVWLLGRQARELQELSCDVLCQQANADYPIQLAELMIDNARLNSTHANLLLSANIFNRTNLNIKRIKLLQRSYSMKPRHVVSTLVTAILAVATIGLVTAQPEQGSQDFVLHRQIVMPGGGDAIFITRDPAQPLTEEEAAAFSTRHFVVQGEAQPMTDDAIGTLGEGDQYVRMEKKGEDTNISFNFSDTPLAIVLTPLANMALTQDAAEFGVAGVSSGTAVVRKLHTIDQAGGEVATAIVADGARIANFRPALSSGAGPHDQPVSGRTAVALALPLSPNLQIEDEADKNRLVSVNAENVTLEAALEIISAEANCNVFLEEDTIVVNSCAN
ncbi:MAG: M56 family metallopeptidase [Pseudomonadota bacterium]